LQSGEDIYLKLNCEGVEVDIVEDLLDSNEFGRVRSAMIDPTCARSRRSRTVSASCVSDLERRG
jgi:hypothetical protein